MNFVYLKFEELSNLQLFEILELRQRVFIVEQDCAYADIDSKDKQALHLLGMVEQQLVAYARLLPPGLSYAEASIGRVVVSPDFRGQDIGKTLMQAAIVKAQEVYAGQDLQIGAQQYLLAFYQELGFAPNSEVYLEDGIPHIDMLLNSP